MLNIEVHAQQNEKLTFFDKVQIKCETFHGRMLNILTPLPNSGKLNEIINRIAQLFTAILIYPVWGFITVINKCFGKSKIKPNYEISYNENSTKLIKSEIEKNLEHWSSLTGISHHFKGKEVKVLFGLEIGNYHKVQISCFIENSIEGFNSFKRNLDFKMVGDYKIKPTYNMELLVLGELEPLENEHLVQFSYFNQFGNNGHYAPTQTELKEDFLNILKRRKLIENNSEQIWDESGKFIK